MSKKPATSVARRVRGAAMVEYALLLVAVLLVAAGAFKHLGSKVASSTRSVAHSI